MSSIAMRKSATRKARVTAQSHMHRGDTAKNVPVPPRYMLEMTTSRGSPTIMRIMVWFWVVFLLLPLLLFLR